MLLLVFGSLAAGITMHWLWNQNSQDKKAADKQVRYISLGEHSLARGERSVTMQVSLEFVGTETERTLVRLLPLIKGQVTRRLSRMEEKDLRKLQTLQGKQELAKDILGQIRDKLPDEDAPNVREILYERFLMGE